MRKARYSLYFIASLLLLSACTKTVYQEVPATDTQTNGTSSTTASGTANNSLNVTSVPGNAAASTETNNSVTTVANDDPTGLPPTQNNANQAAMDQAAIEQEAILTAGVNTAEVNAIIADAAGNTTGVVRTPAVIGEPGAIVDCNLLLPCRWVSASQDFILTVGSVDNTGTLNRLSVQYTVNTSHDSELLLGNGSTALGPGGTNFNLISQSLGTSNGLKPQAVLAGENITGSTTYDRPADSDTLVGWTLTVVDNGLPRTVGFMNLPIGVGNTVAVNCAGVLPCQWESDLQDVVITLVAVGGYSANGRLNVNFNVVTQRDMTIALDAGAVAISISGEQYEGRTHTLGALTGFSEIQELTSSGVTLPGSVSFFRTARAPAALKSLGLVIYEDAPIPRWNPQFLNLPTL